MSITREQWEAAQERYQAHAADAGDLDKDAADALREASRSDSESGFAEATAWALLALSRRVEAITEMFLDFMEPPERGRDRG